MWVFFCPMSHYVGADKQGRIILGTVPQHFYYIYESLKLRFKLSLLLHLTPTLKAPLTFCKFAKKLSRFHLKL